MNYPPFWSVMWMQMADVRFEIFTSKLNPYMVYGIPHQRGAVWIGPEIWVKNRKQGIVVKKLKLTCRTLGPRQKSL